MKTVGPCASPIHPTTNWWRMRRHKSFIAFDHWPSPLVLERIVQSLTIPPSQCGSNDSNLWPGSDTTCRTLCLTDPSNDQLVKDEGAQIFYSIWSQTKPIGIGANCEIPHKNHQHSTNKDKFLKERRGWRVGFKCLYAT